MAAGPPAPPTIRDPPLTTHQRRAILSARRPALHDAPPRRETMAEQHSRDREPLVRVAVAESDFEAQLMKDELAAAGIRSMLRSGDVLTTARAIGVSAPF